jgi:hypothetical protein
VKTPKSTTVLPNPTSAKLTIFSVVAGERQARATDWKGDFMGGGYVPRSSGCDNKNAIHRLLNIC